MYLIPSKKVSTVFLTLVSTLFLIAQVYGQEEFQGKVVGVSDGDTISVTRDGKAEKVRLAFIDCPEKRQAFGQRAKQFTSDMVFGKTVTVKIGSKDRYGRMIGEIILEDGGSLNQELLKVGLAWQYRRYSKDPYLLRLEQTAREEQQGLWIDANPIAPWEFRRPRGIKH